MNMPAQPDLFELNKITHQEHLENLMILLTYDDYASGQTGHFGQMVLSVYLRTKWFWVRVQLQSLINVYSCLTQLTLTCSNSTIETLKKK